MIDRNVYAQPATGSVAEGVTPEPQQPKPWEKLLNYFPAEATALYATLAPLLDSALNGNSLRWALWSALLLSVIFGALFLKKFWHIERTIQIVISSVAFLVYMAALGGPFAQESWYSPIWAVIASVVVSAFIIFAPAPTKPGA